MLVLGFHFLSPFFAGLSNLFTKTICKVLILDLYCHLLELKNSCVNLIYKRVNHLVGNPLLLVQRKKRIFVIVLEDVVRYTSRTAVADSFGAIDLQLARVKEQYSVSLEV